MRDMYGMVGLTDDELSKSVHLGSFEVRSMIDGRMDRPRSNSLRGKSRFIGWSNSESDHGIGKVDERAYIKVTKFGRIDPKSPSKGDQGVILDEILKVAARDLFWQR